MEVVPDTLGVCFLLAVVVEEGGAEKKVSRLGFCTASVLKEAKRSAGGGPDFGPRWLNWLSRECGSIWCR